MLVWATLLAAAVSAGVSYLVAQSQTSAAEHARVADLRLSAYAAFVNQAGGITSVDGLILQDLKLADKKSPLSSSDADVIIDALRSETQRRIAREDNLSAETFSVELVGSPRARLDYSRVVDDINAMTKLLAATGVAGLISPTDLNALLPIKLDALEAARARVVRDIQVFVSDVRPEFR